LHHSKISFFRWVGDRGEFIYRFSFLELYMFLGEIIMFDFLFGLVFYNLIAKRRALCGRVSALFIALIFENYERYFFL